MLFLHNMEMKCLQCNSITNKTTNRIVRDSCGHLKCRMCLLNEISECISCVKLSTVAKTTASDFQEKNNIVSVICKTSDSEPNVKEGRKKVVIISNEVLLTSKDNVIVINKAKKGKKKTIDVINKAKKGKKKTIDVINKAKKGKKKIIDHTEKLNNVSIDIPSKKSRESNVPVVQKNLPSHINVIDVGGTKLYECTLCNRKFKSRTQKLYHSYCNSTKPHACHLCHLKFVKKSKLVNHLNIHSGNRHFICNVCNASFYLKYKFVAHCKTHTGEKTYACTKCKAAFFNATSLKNHEIRHSNLKPFQCKICPSTFKNSSNLKRHEITHTDVKVSCSVCGKEYKSKNSLRLHSKIHAKDKSFVCSLCPKAFYIKKDLDRHKMTHMESKCFQCQLCKMTFRRQDNLSRHFRNSHPDIQMDKSKHIIIKKKKYTEKIDPEDKINPVQSQESPEKLKSVKRNISKPSCTPTQCVDAKIPNFINYIPKEFVSTTKETFNTADHSLGTTDFPAVSKDNEKIINFFEKCNEAILKKNGDHIKDAENFTTLEIIRANSERQSVIFNWTGIKETTSTNNSNSDSLLATRENGLVIKQAVEPIPVECVENDTPSTEIRPNYTFYNDNYFVGVQDTIAKKLPYFHKKVHYDKMSNHLSLPSRDQNEKELDLSVKSASETFSNKSEFYSQKETKKYFSPESIELYKKILISGYKSAPDKNKIMHEPAETKQCAQQYSYLSPLVPLSSNSVVRKNNYSDICIGNNLSIYSESGTQLSKNVCNNQDSAFVGISNLSNHSNDLHWKKKTTSQF